MLHGWGCNRGVWRSMLVELRPWANITLLDLPGCAPGSDSVNTEDLEGLLADVLQCAPRRAVYVGWSLGGQLALELGARHPERVVAVVTICSNPMFVAAGNWPGMAPESFDQFFKGVQADPVVALKRFDMLQVAGAKQPRQLLRKLQKLGRQPASTKLLSGLRLLETLDQRKSMTSLPVPQLHLLAEQDALVPATLGTTITCSIAGLPSAEVRVIPGSCHLAPLDASAQLAHHMRQFLAAAEQLCLPPPVTPELEKTAVAASFSRAAKLYDSSAQLQRDVGKQLLTCLDQWEGAPTSVLDLGCGTGYFCAELASRYSGAQYLGLDIAEGMVDYARGRCPEDCDWLVADAEALPLDSESVDLVFSSLALQWCYRPEHLFAELARVLRPGGLCVFTTLGPDTLCELRSAWAAVDSHQHVNNFLPVSELERAVERIPEVSMKLERSAFRMEYARVRELLDELKALGAHNMNRSRAAGLTSRRTLQGMLQAYESWRRDDLLPATYDVIFGVLEKA